MRTDISKYSLHDYSYLIREWKALAKEWIKDCRIGKVDGFPILESIHHRKAYLTVSICLQEFMEMSRQVAMVY